MCKCSVHLLNRCIDPLGRHAKLSQPRNHFMFERSDCGHRTCAELMSYRTALHVDDRVVSIFALIRWIDEPLDRDLLAKVQRMIAGIKDQTWMVGRPENNQEPNGSFPDQ